MSEKNVVNLQWSKIIKNIENIKPEFGNIILEITYHQGILTKIKFLQKEEIVLFNVKNNNGSL